MTARGLLWAMLCAAGAANADMPDVLEVISPQPDSVSVTIYRDLFALITETRTVDLPDGPVQLSFDGVVETLLPASAVVADSGRVPEERNFDYEALTPNNLFRKSIGRQVTLTRTRPGSGRVEQVAATIVSAGPGGIVLRTTDGVEALHCSGISDGIVFAQIPDGLNARPRLSVRLGPGPAGKRTIRLSYLAHGFSWKSDYVARLADTGERIDLKGWVTLRNFTQTRFRDAQVQVVAGRLNLLDESDGGTSLIGPSEDYPNEDSLRAAREEVLTEMLEEQSPTEEDYVRGLPTLFGGCFPMPLPPALQLTEKHEVRGLIGTFPDGALAEVMVTGFRASVAEREELADYQMYRLPWRTDLAARQTKQALFLDKRSVRVERFYGLQFNAEDHTSEDEYRLMLQLGFENRKASGLGEPLPEGVLRLFEPGPAGDLFSGEALLYDTAVSEPVELSLAGAVDLDVEVDVTHEDKGNLLPKLSTNIEHVSIRVANAKRLPVTVEIRQQIHEYMDSPSIRNASHRTLRKHGDFAWRMRLAANSADTLSYELRQFEPD